MELVLENIVKSFGKKNVLQNTGFTFEQGKIYGLLGRNGAGKTTLFNGLSGETKLDGGNAWLLDNGIRRELKEDDIGYVYSLPILPEFLTGYEFVKFFLDINRDKLQTDTQIDEYFEMMRITMEDRHRLIKNYSHGMKNKIQMLLFLITKPPVILLDEPLTSFDVIVALEMKNLLRSMKKDHILIFSTHILQLASDLCDELVILNKGQLSSVPKELLGSPGFEQSVIDLLQDDADGEERPDAPNT
ncbi:ABC transporter ATP-binding protein [Paenibacillus urinalis]|uniref:ABC transporter ATP-binding protein n=1 Tax=Paenibacillus urinalis TaxID=521520 RepID=A0AAX3MWM3_9BACL|nr:MULTISPECIES: ABC transporter ATP-binding protein [Paenibacillus]WDH81677.1 ABC transporter ATP-binding protein [Paenibacillus urinalis]WDH97722.1 ABC transporter ATP-binding protein [Paenibacillus urinalis]WDI01397.1 ABC transporter ATP-binding protein [Paenibacillus urinalis]GAK42181.1 multidrug ABC transporter ATP-binding protein [Paenibacillus sp. TCA20]